MTPTFKFAHEFRELIDYKKRPHFKNKLVVDKISQYDIMRQQTSKNHDNKAIRKLLFKKTTQGSSLQRSSTKTCNELDN